MDILKRQLAPLTKEAWHEIDERATQVLKSNLTARKAVRVRGPLGLDYTAVPEGRLAMLDDEPGNVRTGIHQVKPLVETRVSFELDRWELDNIARGARDVNLEALEDAAKKAARFEEDAVFNGYERGMIAGLRQVGAEARPFGASSEAILESLSSGVLALKDAFVLPPLTLVVGEKAWQLLHKESAGYPLSKRVEKLIGGEILYSPALEGALLLPYDHEDLELTLGMDFSIGYESHDSKKVRLFVAESFTFRVLDPGLIVQYSV
ncbi:MAG: bacteriocin [Firmicutes bacterium]|nr:bacteriocin [Bacillota bacterium]